MIKSRQWIIASNTAELLSAISPERRAELQETLANAPRGVRDPQKIKAAAERMDRMCDFLAEWNMIALSESASDLFRQQRRRKIRVGSQDLKNAALARTEDTLPPSANLRDFQNAPELRVENWLRE